MRPNETIDETIDDMRRRLLIRRQATRGSVHRIADIVAAAATATLLLLHSPSATSCSVSSSFATAEAFVIATTTAITPRPPSYSHSSSRGSSVRTRHLIITSPTATSARLYAIIEPTTTIDDNTLLLIAKSAAATTASLLVAWWWWCASRQEWYPNIEEEQQRQREQCAYIEPRVLPYTDEELLMYNGSSSSNDEDADGRRPILIAIKNHVFNVGTNNGYQFYGPKGEYHIMAGKDASIFLAKNTLVIEDNDDDNDKDEKNVKLSIAQEANLEMWYWIIKNKYPLVGTYNGGYTNNNSNEQQQ